MNQTEMEVRAAGDNAGLDANTLRERRATLGCYAGLFAVFLAAYGSTLLPGMHSFGDVTKAQFVGRLLGTTHPPGYPLYNVLTWIVSWVPLGTLAQRVNAFSALCALATIGMLFRFQLVECRTRKLPAVLATCALGFSPTFWSQAVIAEVYTLNSALIVGVLSLLLSWRRTGDERLYWCACGLYAVSFGNHLTMITLLPAFVYAVLSSDRRVLRARSIAVVLALVVLGASQYLYPLWRTKVGAPYLEYRVSNFSELVNYVTGDHYRSRMLAFAPKELFLDRLPKFAGLLVLELGPLALLAPAGVFVGSSRYRLVILGLVFVGELGWVLTYDIPDIHIYLIPVVLLLSVFLGRALDALLSAPRFWRVLALAATVSLVAHRGWVSWNSIDHSQHVRFTEQVDRELGALGEGAVIVGSIPYGKRMAYVHRLVAEGLGAQRNLHLAPGASKAAVSRYCKREGRLRELHSNKPIGHGLRVFIAENSDGSGWEKAGFTVIRRRGRLAELRLRSEP